MASEHDDAVTTMEQREMERTEAAQRVVANADAASQSALIVLATFIDDLQEARRELAGRNRPDLARAIMAARDQIGPSGRREGQR